MKCFKSLILVGAMLVFFFLRIPQAFAGPHSSNAKKVDENSVEGKNVKAAAEFIRSMGDSEHADNILKWLKDGKIWWDPTLEENGETSDWSKDITIGKYIIHHSHASGKEGQPFDPEKDFSNIEELARTLFHEKVHAHQNYLWVACTDTLSLLPGAPQMNEVEAWTQTIYAMDHWITKLYKDWLDTLGQPSKKAEREALRKKLDTLIGDKQSYLGSFIENKCYGLTCSIFQQWQKDMEELKKKMNEWEKQYGLRSATQSSTAKEIGQVIKQEQKDARTALAMVPYFPRDKDVEVSLTGKGRAAGEVFDLALTSHVDQPIELSCGVGLVFTPTDSSYQTMITGEPIHVDIPPNGTTHVPVDGYCMNHDKLPPPDHPVSNLTWHTPDSLKPFLPMRDIIATGNRLADEGKYSKDIQDPQTYKTGVIQRSLWYSVNLVGKDVLEKDIDKQLSNLPKEKQPTKEEKEKVVNSIWNDVNLTLKEARATQK